MKKLAILFTSLLSISLLASSANAGQAADALSSCVADSTTGKDRKELAQWVFAAMTAHPEIQPMSNLSIAKRDELDKKLAFLATRLITEDCKSEAKVAIEKEGGESFKVAFSALGRLAMQELMADPAVNASFSRYTQYLDKSKFEGAFGAPK